MGSIDLILIDGQAVTTSRQIANVFHKQHAHVLRKIQELGCSPEFAELNFSLSDYRDPKGEFRKEFQITRDGFTMLAMGFTGKKAMEFKEAYINAFNAMESKCHTHAEEFYLVHKSVMNHTGEALIRIDPRNKNNVTAIPYKDGKIGSDQIGQIPPPPNTPTRPTALNTNRDDATYVLQVIHKDRLDSHVIPNTTLLLDPQAMTHFSLNHLFTR